MSPIRFRRLRHLPPLLHEPRCRLAYPTRLLMGHTICSELEKTVHNPTPRSGSLPRSHLPANQTRNPTRIQTRRGLRERADRFHAEEIKRRRYDKTQKRALPRGNGFPDQETWIGNLNPTPFHEIQMGYSVQPGPTQNHSPSKPFQEKNTLCSAGLSPSPNLTFPPRLGSLLWESKRGVVEENRREL